MKQKNVIEMEIEELEERMSDFYKGIDIMFGSKTGKIVTVLFMLLISILLFFYVDGQSMF